MENKTEIIQLCIKYIKFIYKGVALHVFVYTKGYKRLKHRGGYTTERHC